MTETTPKKRIFQIAKELNISHKDIIEYLQEEGIKVGSLNAPIEFEVYEKILNEFSKEKQQIERFRKEQALPREARVREAFLAWFPFTRTRFDVVGWTLGTVERRKKKGSQWVTVEEPVERQVQESVDRTAPTADMAEFGVHRIDLKGDRILDFDEQVLRRKGMVFRPSRPPAEAAEELAQTAMEKIGKRRKLHRVTFSWLALPYVEKESMATRGSTSSSARVLPAVAIAMWASSSAVGSTATAASANTSTRSGGPSQAIRKKLEGCVTPSA